MKLVILALAILAAACSSETPPIAGPDTNGGTDKPAPAKDLNDVMHEYFDTVEQIKALLIEGKLPEARTQARKITTIPMEQHPSWKTYLLDLRATGNEVELAKDLGAAADATARLAESCGRCHDERAAPLEFKMAPEPANDDLEMRMQRHRWAADRMWEGLVGPSVESWNLGARSLSASVLAPSGAQADVLGLAHTVGELAQKAVVAKPPDRARLYGLFLATCASCHQMVRGPAAK